MANLMIAAAILFAFIGANAASDSKLDLSLQQFNCSVSAKDVQRENMVFSKNMTSTMLYCNITTEENKQVINFTWHKAIEKSDSFKFEAISKDNNNLKHTEDNSLKINDPKIEDAGVYVAEINFKGPMKSCYVCHVNLTAAPEVQDFDKAKNLIEGDKIDLRCLVKGYPFSSVVWYKNNQSLTADSRNNIQTVLDGQQTAELVIYNVQHEDEGNYTCEAYSSYFNETSRKSLLVSVKDKWAALWPFLGIVGEVVVLCTIIFIYEKRRNKQVQMDEKAAAEEVDGSASEKKEGLRHRTNNPSA